MPLSRGQQKAAFDHVLGTVFGFSNPDRPLRKALVEYGADKITDLLTIPVARIGTLTYNDGGTPTDVPEGDKNMIKVYKDYLKFRKKSGDPVGDNHTGVTREEFDDFRGDPEYVPGDVDQMFTNTTGGCL